MVAPGCASKTVQKPARSPKITSDKKYCHVGNTAKQLQIGKTPILQEILRTRKQHVEHCVFSEATRSFQSARCVRNELQFRTAQQNQKSFPWMQVYGCTVYPRLTYGI